MRIHEPRENICTAVCTSYGHGQAKLIALQRLDATFLDDHLLHRHLLDRQQGLISTNLRTPRIPQGREYLELSIMLLT
jgi:hypothetical protein